MSTITIEDVINYKATEIYEDFLGTITKIQFGNFQDLDSWDEANLGLMEGIFKEIINIRAKESHEKV